MNIYLDIEKLLVFAQSHLLLDDLDVIYVRNLLLDELKVTEYIQYEVDSDEIEAMTSVDAVLEPIVNYAIDNSVVKKSDRTRFAMRVMNLLTKRPGEITDQYLDLEASSVQKATEWLDDYMVKSNYAAYAAVRESCDLAEKEAKGKSKIPAGMFALHSNSAVEKLLYYAQTHLLLDDLDVPWLRGILVDELKLTDCAECEISPDEIEELAVPDTLLEPILDYAVENKIVAVADRVKFSDKIMSLLIKRPSEVNDIFFDLYRKNAVKAFEWLYDYAIKSNYISYTAIQKNRHWEAKGTKGKLEVTVNLARPEKSNREIEKAATEKGEKYPKCPLCKENEGYSGKGTFRKNLRTVPIVLGGEDWFWQYSPYSYFNQHGIAVNADHTPMEIRRSTFLKLLDFTDFIPTYFIGCNASLPRIGGSVLSHDHFQGGKSSMPMFKAPVLKKLKSLEHPYIKIEMLDWYNSVVRISYTNKERLADFADIIREKWALYSDLESGIIAHTGEIRHNSLAVIARKLPDSNYCLDLILRNNRTSKEFPDGIFAAHPENQPIKSEAVGIIESLGLFILPGRLDSQLSRIEKFLTKETRYNAAKLDAELAPFSLIIEKLIKEAGAGKLSEIEAHLNVKDEVNRICEEILSDTAVFKKDEAGQAAFAEFLKTAGIE